MVGTSSSSDDNVTSVLTSVRNENVDLDLRLGIVKGYSQFVTFVVSPSPTDDDRCSAQSVVKIDLSEGPFNRVRLTLDYSEPRLWTLDMSDSGQADGYGISDIVTAAADDDDDDDDGDDDNVARNGSTGNMAETHVCVLSTGAN